MIKTLGGIVVVIAAIVLIIVFVRKDRMEAPQTTAPDIAAQTWVWVATVPVDGPSVSPIRTDAFTLTFANDGTVAGTTDCNGFGGSYTLGVDGMLSFGPLAMTKMYCEGSQEQVFVDGISKARTAAIDDEGNLVLNLEEGSGSMIFKKG